VEERKVKSYRQSTFPPRKQRTNREIITGTFMILYNHEVQKEVFGALKRHNWTQARIWMGWFR
jgi:hypothetical protein